MSQGVWAVVVGIGLIIVGLMIAGGGDQGSQSVRNVGFSFVGSVRQSIDNIKLSATGQRQKSPRD